MRVAEHKPLVQSDSTAALKAEIARLRAELER
jgi:uncharacterized small protein (DUF1192 family)